jgi:hypothetical protein
LEIIDEFQLYKDERTRGLMDVVEQMRHSIEGTP